MFPALLLAAHHCSAATNRNRNDANAARMFAGPIGLVMLICEWLLLYFAWVHPWSCRQQQQQQPAAVADAGDGGEGGREGGVELGLLAHAESRGHDHDDDEDDAAAAASAAAAAPPAQTAAIQALYDEMGAITRTQKVPPPPPHTHTRAPRPSFFCTQVRSNEGSTMHVACKHCRR